MAPLQLFKLSWNDKGASWHTAFVVAHTMEEALNRFVARMTVEPDDCQRVTCDLLSLP